MVELGFRQPGRPKMSSFLFVCLFVCHAFEHQTLCARFRHEGVGVHHTWESTPEADISRFVYVSSRVGSLFSTVESNLLWRPLVLYQVDLLIKYFIS